MSRIYEALSRTTTEPDVEVAGTPPKPDLMPTLEHYVSEGVPVLPPRIGPPAVQKREITLGHAPARPTADFDGKLVSQDGKSLPAEQYRVLAIALHEAQVDRGLQTVVVTSAVPREGKTLTTVNLGLTLSESYARRVLLIDADLRSPSIHHAFGIAGAPGLSHAMSRPSGPLPLVQVSPLLWVLPAGRPDSNPLACLSSGRIRTLIEQCASQFDWVLVDTPPVGVGADAQLIARHVQAVLLVIRAGAAPYSAVEKAAADLGRESIIGTVLNGVDERRFSSDLYDYYSAGYAR